jgi:hypothetical protein
VVKNLLPAFSLSKEVMKSILKIWWEKLPSGRETYLAQITVLCTITGKILRIDHTYKFVKTLGVHDEGTWVRFKIFH